MIQRRGTFWHHRARAAGLVRTIVVGTSTLAILIVCFSIYQASQKTPEIKSQTPSIAPPSARGQPVPPPVDPGDVPGIDAGGAMVGPGERIRMTFYPKEGQKGRIEVEVKSWTPVHGSANEFILIEPDIRMRSADGNAIRIMANRGMMEAERKSGTGLDPQRGTLSDGIVIEYDRLTEEQRSNLPEAIRGTIEPSQLVRIEMDELEFDMEYGKLLVPGGLKLRASDVEFDTAGLEIRFNDAQNRVERLRINGGGRVSLLTSATGSGLAVPALSEESEKNMTLVEWMRASIQSQLASTATAQEVAKPQEQPKPRPTVTADGVPILRLRSDRKPEKKVPTQYFAQFEGDVRVVQKQGEILRSQLHANLLEIVRSLSDKEKQSVTSEATAANRSADQQPQPQDPEDRIDLTWTERLLVENCAANDQRCDAGSRSSIHAKGSPARITFAQGKATCNDLSFEPDGSTVQLNGTISRPATVDMKDAGVITGRSIRTVRDGDDVRISVTGPGQLIRGPEESTGDTSRSDSIISFAESLEIAGQYVMKTRLETTSGLAISRKRELQLDNAVFTGDVSMNENETSLVADTVTLSFDHSMSASNNVSHVDGNGHVVLTLGTNKVWCNEIDIFLRTESGGKTVPVSAMAKGDVTAQQDKRTVKARDHLTVDFAMMNRPAPPFDLDKARQIARDSGRDPDSIDWAHQQRLYENKDRREPFATRLRAAGAVSVVDPLESLDVVASTLDCDLGADREMRKATIHGSKDHPASVTLDTLTVVGPEIHLNVQEQQAQVPAAGRLTFLSNKDLDGKELDRPMPIAITWSDSMRYQGRENRSVFLGSVHATSKSGTTFDCDRLQIDFEDVPSGSTARDTDPQWWQPILTASTPLPGSLRSSAQLTASAGMVFEEELKRLQSLFATDSSSQQARFSKEPASVLATGNAVAVISEYDVSGDLISRSSISGPKLSVNLRSEASKLLIEGRGKLLLEDLKPALATDQPQAAKENGMFDIGSDAGISNTLIEWKDMMWYDFSIAQTRFSGEVQLSYLSGTELLKVRDDLNVGDDRITAGRTTFLSCGQLTVDFAMNNSGSANIDSKRMGGLSTNRLKQFEARTDVVLQDSGEGLNLTAHRVVFRKDSCLLSIQGSESKRAHIIKKRLGQLPHQVSVKNIFYNTCSGEIEVSQPALQTP